MQTSKGTTSTNLLADLHPERANGCISEQLAALLVYLLEAPPVTIPCIIGIKCDEDGWLWACTSDRSHEFSGFLGHRAEVTHNLRNWCQKWDRDPTILTSRLPDIREETKWSELMIRRWHESFGVSSELRSTQTWIL